MKSNIEQKKVWDALAKTWYGHRQRPWKDIEKLMKIVISQKKGRILEIGCGNCRDLLPFTEAGFECYGIDFSEEMLKVAEQFAKKKNIKIKLKYGWAQNIPFQKNSFDYAMSIAVLHHLSKEDHLRALKEIFRVLSNNGIAIISVWNHLHPKFWKFVLYKEKFVPWNFQGTIYRRYYYFFSYCELKKLIKKAGFKIIQSSSPFARNISFVVKKIVPVRRNY